MSADMTLINISNNISVSITLNLGNFQTTHQNARFHHHHLPCNCYASRRGSCRLGRAQGSAEAVQLWHCVQQYLARFQQ